MNKRVGAPRNAGPDEQPPLIIATGPQIQQQQSSVASVHTQQSSVGLLDNSHQTTIIVSTQQVINYSKGALQYAGPGPQYPAGGGGPKPPAVLSQQPHMAPPIQPRHKGVLGSQSPGVQVAVGPLGAGGGAQFQRLKVEDALSYLDQVKYKFNNQPQVYNDFLDIMKEFKSQSIDTPGVIARVSNLFKGHPELIVGFNTFLPPGYKIEVQANDQGYAYQVSVSMPSPNSALQHQGGHNNVSHAGSQAVLGSGATGLLVGPPTVPSQQPHSQHHLVQIIPGSTGGPIVHTIPQSLPSPSPSPTIPAPSPVAPFASLAPLAPVASQTSLPAAPAPLPPQQPLQSQAPPTNTLHHISQAHQQLEAPPTHSAQQQPVEFNHAIEYVNKIKNRFNRQPEKYKRFLEILHAYQRGQKELKEPQVKQQTEQEVYAQVAKLFENQDDLLAEFGQFLPDATSGGGGGMGSAAIKSATAALDAVRPSQEPIRPRAASQAMQQRSSGIESMMETETSYHTASARPSSPVGYQSSAPPVLAVPPRQLDQPPASQISSNHHQKHSTSSHHPSSGLSSSTHHLKRSPSFSNNQLGSVGPPPTKKHKLYAPRDVSHAEVARYGTLAEFGFFDRVHKAVRSQEVYDNFLRCLMLFNNEVISKSELLSVSAPFFSRHPELQRWLQEFLGPSCGAPASPPAASPPGQGALSNGPQHYTNAPLLAQGYNSGLYQAGLERYTGDMDTLGGLGAQLRQDRPQGDAAMEVDLTTCKRLGTSYCALPRGSAESAARRCSGRTALCREVLNDSWVSFPTWAEDSTFVTSRKTQYEEYIYRCEDERFELDVVIETNGSTILALEAVQKKLLRMSSEEAAKFHMDDQLGGTSPTIHQRALKRIYGEKAPDIIAGLKKNPCIAVPVVLRRLKAKEEEWREAQKGFNKQWREQNEKYYLKSLDHQGINFKQNDLKSLRSKSLINEIETLFEERRDQQASNVSAPVSASGAQLCARLGRGADGSSILADATELLIHHVRRQTAVQKQEKQRIKQLLKHFLPDLFSRPRVPLSDDERDDDDKELDVALDSPLSGGEDTKPARGSEERDTESGVPDIKPINDSKVNVKQEREASSESDSNTGPAEKATRRSEKLSNRDNKENLKTMRNNSAEDVDNKDAVLWSKSSESSATSVKAGRRREGSSDSCSGRVKVEPMDTTPATDITIAALPSLLPRDKWSMSSMQPVVFMGSSHWYVFLRLHSVLCQRLSQMKALAERLAREEAGDAKLRKPATATALRLKPDNSLAVSQYYSALLEMVRSVLDGNMEASAYEDGLREMFGIHAFVAFTLDKIVSYAVRQLQQCVQERVATRCVDLHVQERHRSGPNPSAAAMAAHQRRAERLLREEHAFKMCIYGGEDSRVTFELLESGGAPPTCSGSGGCSPPSTAAPSLQHPPSAPARLADWARYRERYTNPVDTVDLFKDANWIGRKAMFLQRNIRRSKRHQNSHAARLAAANGCVAPSAPLLPNSSGGSPAANPSPPQLLDAAARPATEHYVNEDRTECKFDANSYQMVFVVNKEQYLYVRDSLEKARKTHPSVTLRLDARWHSWLRAWCTHNVPPAAARSTHEWLRRGSRTIVRGTVGGHRTPYRPYNTFTTLTANVNNAGGGSVSVNSVSSSANTPPAMALGLPL